MVAEGETPIVVRGLGWASDRSRGASVVSAGSYVLGAVAAGGRLARSSGSPRTGLRQRLLPGWEGAPARLVEAIVAVALLIWLSRSSGPSASSTPGALVVGGRRCCSVAAAALLSAGGCRGGATLRPSWRGS